MSATVQAQTTIAPASFRVTDSSRHFEASAMVAAPPDQVFARLDDQTRLGGHMEKSSWMMGGGSMGYAIDDAGGKAVGSKIRMSGSAFGISLDVEEVVTERAPPLRKEWRTIGAPRMIILAGYAMGFELRPERDGAQLRVWIDYDLPPTLLGGLLGLLLAPLYARWCVRRMTGDAVRAFSG